MQAIITMHGWLQGLARPPFRGRVEIRYPLSRRASVKDVVEALGVPHPEIGSLAIDGHPVGFGHILAPGEYLAVYPLRPPVAVTIPSPLRTAYPDIRFLVDHNVAKLAAKLRMVGLDAIHHPAWHDAELAALACSKQRILLSRDVQLLKRRQVEHGHLVRECLPDRQLAEVIHFYGLWERLAPFSRCMRCNQPLEIVEKSEVIDLLEPLTKKYYHAFRRCPCCAAIYWAGSHRARMEELLRRLEQYDPLPC
ncbi:MAG: Mut7-C RNAse domain-containing protein [Thermodesulfobacteriota bacterium]